MITRKMRMRAFRALLFLLLPASLFFRSVGKETPREELIETLVQAGGYLLMLAGLGIRMWSLLYINQRKSKELVNDGPYSLCRNPLYVGTILIGVGIAVAFQCLLMGIILLGVIVPFHVATILAEERHLREIFGETFDQYSRTTPRFLPRFSSYHSPEAVTVSVRSIRRAVVDASGVLVLLPLAQIVNILQEMGVLPALWHTS